LRPHLKLHEERELEAGLGDDGNRQEDGEEDGEVRPKKRRRGGEMGIKRDWKREIEECRKEVKLFRLRYISNFFTMWCRKSGYDSS
jgi:hypothetical protein